MIKAGIQDVSDIVITLPDGSAIQSSGIKSQDVNVTITPPIPSVVYNESTAYNNLEVKLIVNGAETTFKTTGQSGVPLGNADLLNIRRLQPEAIIVESVSGVTTGTAGAITQFKNFYPFSNEKFKLGRSVVASPISSVKYFAQQEGETDVATKIENAFGVNVNELIVTSGNDVLLSGNAEQVAKDLDVIATALEQTNNAASEQVFRNIAKEVITETTARSGISEFIEDKIVTISTSVKKEVLGIPPTGNLTSEDLNIATNVANNIVYIIQTINDAEERGNIVEVASVVINVLNNLDITQPSGTVSALLQTAVESEIETELGGEYIPATTTPQAPENLNISIVEVTTTTTTTTTTTPDPSLTPAITQQPLNNYSSLSGSEAIPFSVTATGPSGMTYQWQAWGYDANFNSAWVNIPNKTSASVTITGDELAQVTQYESDYFRDTQIRCVISASGFADIISDVVYFDKYHRFGGYLMAYDANNNWPQGSEQINGVFYQVLNSATGPITLEIYEMVVYSYDLSWVTGNDISLVLQESSDATNWSNVSTTYVRGIPYASITIPSGSGTKYYRVSITINWPLNVNNGTASADKPAFTFPNTTYSTELKVTWA